MKTRDIIEGRSRNYIARLRRDPRMKAVFDGFISQALIEADQLYPAPHMDRERTNFAARRSAELAMSFVLDNDGEYQMIYDQWEKAVKAGLEIAQSKGPSLIMTPGRTSDILEELKRRDLEAADPADRAAREKAWNPNPPCPDCGSFDHFEC